MQDETYAKMVEENLLLRKEYDIISMEIVKANQQSTDLQRQLSRATDALQHQESLRSALETKIAEAEQIKTREVETQAEIDKYQKEMKKLEQLVDEHEFLKLRLEASEKQVQSTLQRQTELQHENEKLRKSQGELETASAGRPYALYNEPSTRFCTSSYR